LTPASLRAFEQTQFQGDDEEGEPTRMGLFLFINDEGEYGHDGSENGVSTEFRYDHDGNGVIVLCNGDNAETAMLTDELMEFAVAE